MSVPSHVREVADIVGNLLAASRPDSAVGRKLAIWLREQESLFGIVWREIVCPRAKGASKKLPSDDKPLSPAAWKRLAQAVAGAGERSSPAPLVANALGLGVALKLSDLEARLFALVALISYLPPLETLCDRIAETRLWASEEMLAVMLKERATETSVALGRGMLTSLKLIDGVAERPGRFDLHVPYRMLDALRPPIEGLAEIERALLGAPLGSDLAWEDFDHVAAERDFAAALLKGAAARRELGINLLVYGPPGTGKTELAKAMAQRIGAALYAVGESDEYGEEPSRHDRLAALQLSERLLRGRGGACLLFDEMEDILSGGQTVNYGGKWQRRAGSKVFFNRLLERNAVPIVWTANSVEEFDPAFVRRMSFAFEMKVPARRVRKRQWLQAAERRGLPLADGAADALAERHRIPASLTESAARAIAVAEVTPEQLGFVVERLIRARGEPLRGQRHHPVPCDLALLNADRDLARLEACLPRAPRGVSFCFHGPPGTGKSLYARRLAERMNLEPMEIKGSDLLSKWVGETEQRIAAAFEEATAEERFLIVDEAESLIWSRAGAMRAWEVSMVNEFLTGIENHRFPVACTTNQLAHFDEAALRRFTFKVKFDFLSPDQAEAAFTRYFGLSPPPSLRRMNALALGDFAVVKKQLACMDGGARGPAEIVALLEAEVAAKPGQPARMGF